MRLLDAAAGAVGLGFILLLIIIGLYILPGIVASLRGAKNAGPVWVIDIFLGWSLIGWVVALAMAFGETKADADKRHSTVIVNTAAPSTTPPPAPPPTPALTPVATGGGARFCGSCGAPAGSGKFCTECGASLATSMV